MAGVTPLTALFAAPWRGYSHCKIYEEAAVTGAGGLVANVVVRGGCHSRFGRLGALSARPQRQLGGLDPDDRWRCRHCPVDLRGGGGNTGRRRTVVDDGRGNVVSKVDSAH